MLTDDQRKDVISKIFKVLREGPVMDRAEALSVPFWLFEQMAVYAIKETPHEAEYLIQKFCEAFDKSIENIYEALNVPKPQK